MKSKIVYNFRSAATSCPERNPRSKWKNILLLLEVVREGWQLLVLGNNVTSEASHNHLRRSPKMVNMIKRQEFLTQTRYQDFLDYSEETKEFWKINKFESDSPAQEESLRASHFKNVALKKLFISYTAGAEIASLEPLIEDLISKYEESQSKLSASEALENISPLAIDDWPDEFEECIQVFSLCILLHRTDLLKRFVQLLDAANYKGEDTLYEDLLRKLLPDRYDVDEWFHDVYTPLIQAIYADEKEEASQLLDNYCKQWYAAFKQAPWHDSHLQGDEGSYVGYWAFEAGAIAFLYGIDDSKIDHMVYPRDLVDYARCHSASNDRLRL